ncbi:glycosyltransferase family 2 protein [Flavobacterium sp. LAR06]|uniref:glycosyltransferase family 2 protein n=1 Tax=Flavobacterium sp. LAR06 TaxID=3064897 RepID=UPI0035BFB9F6
MSKLLVSIIVPCYNQAQYLSEALQSVLNQTYENWECVIINDGSKDNTEEVAKKWVENDSRFLYIYKENGGLSSARNAALNVVAGDYIQFLDADDCLHEDKLIKSLFQIKDHSNYNIVVSHFKMFKKNRYDELKPFCELSQDILMYDQILHGWDSKFSIPIHCGLFSSSLFDDFRFPENLRAKEDWIMWLTFFQKKISAVFINEILAFYRIHSESMTQEVKLMEESHIQAILHLQTIMPEEVYNKYLITILQQKGEEIIRLKKQIKNYKNSKGYRILARLKRNKILYFFYKFLK